MTLGLFPSHGLDGVLDIPTARHALYDIVLIMSGPKRRERTSGQEPTSIADVLPAVIENIEFRSMERGNVAGVPTGFSGFDNLTGGLQAENLIVLAGHPRVGKTAWALNVAAHATLRARVPTLLFSLELSKTEATNRVLLSEAGIDTDQLRRKRVEYSEWKAKIHPLEERLDGAPFRIDDATAPTLNDLRKKVRNFLRDETLFPRGAADQRALVILDCLDAVARGPKCRGTGGQTAKITRGLKELAKMSRTALVVVSGLNGASELREDKRPRLTDLRGSGSIEDHADVVLFLHQPNRGDHNDDECATDLIVAKHRSAETASLALTFNRTHLRFQEQAPEYEA
jgi:replicative DNA helicase